MAPFWNKGNQGQGGGGKEAQYSGGGLPPAVEPRSPVNPRIIDAQAAAPTTEIAKPKTPEEIIKDEQIKTVSIYHQLMDDMEASVPENGRFFSQLGQKSDGGDNRLVILNEGRKTAEGKFEYAAITDRGPMKLILDDEQRLSEIIMTKLHLFKGIYESHSQQGKNEIVNRSLNFSGGVSGPELLPIGDADQDFLKEAMTKSIEKARTTSRNAINKAALKAEREKQDTAKGLSDLFKQAIKPTGEGSGTPPPPSTATA